MKTEWKKLRKNNVGNVDAGECLNYIGEKMLLAILAWDIGKAGQRKMRKKLGSWIRNTGIDIGRRRESITRNIASWKLNVKCVSVEWGNLIGQDIWWVRSMCWGAVVEKLMVMWGVGEDDTKGKVSLITTAIHVPSLAPSTERLKNRISWTHRKNDNSGSWIMMFRVSDGHHFFDRLPPFSSQTHLAYCDCNYKTLHLYYRNVSWFFKGRLVNVFIAKPPFRPDLQIHERYYRVKPYPQKVLNQDQRWFNRLATQNTQHETSWNQKMSAQKLKRKNINHYHLWISHIQMFVPFSQVSGFKKTFKKTKTIFASVYKQIVRPARWARDERNNRQLIGHSHALLVHSCWALACWKQMLFCH